MVVSHTPRWTLYLHLSSIRPSLVRYVNLGVGYLTPGLTEDLGDMIERGQEWEITSLEDAVPRQCSDIGSLPVGWAHDEDFRELIMHKDRRITSKVICDKRRTDCGFCPHVEPHDVIDNEEYGRCSEKSVCFCQGTVVRCVPA